jgi:chitinase
LFVPFRCAGTCPAGKQLIATDPSGCLSGVQAFCCDAPATTNDPTVADFRQKLTDFKTDPTCPANSHKHSVFNADQRRIAQRSASGVAPFIDELAVVVRGPQSYQQTLFLSTYDDVIGNNINLHAPDFVNWWHAFPQTDPLILCERLLCLYNDASGFLRDYNSSNTHVCTRFPPSRRRGILTRQGNTRTSLIRRNIDLDPDPSPPEPGFRPSTARILNGIVNRDLRLEYMRLVHTITTSETLVEGMAYALLSRLCTHPSAFVKLRSCLGVIRIISIQGGYSAVL